MTRICERMCGELLTERVYETEMDGGRVRSRPCINKWGMVEKTYNARWQELREGKMDS